MSDNELKMTTTELNEGMGLVNIGAKKERQRIVGIIEKRRKELQDLIDNKKISEQAREWCIERRSETDGLLREIESKK